MPTRPRTASKAAAQYEFKTWDQYVAEAQHPPFELHVSADETLLIACPDGAASRTIEVARAANNFDLMMSSLFGEHADRVVELTAAAPAGVLPALLLDVLVHFELAERPAKDTDGPQQGEGSASSS